MARLRRLADSVGCIDDHFSFGEPLAPWGRSDWLVFEIRGTHEDDRSDAESGSFWEQIGVDTDEPSNRELVEDPDFLGGFVDGALGVWEVVADHI